MAESPKDLSLGAYCRAIWRNWFTAMSGPLSVPAAALALYVENQTAKVLLGVTAFVCIWAAGYSIWKSEHERVLQLEMSLKEREENKQRLLNEIGELRVKVGTVRIQMEDDVHHTRFSEAYWQPKFDALQDEIASKIEQFASPAEAHIYRHRGNIQRPLNPMMGGFLNPLLVDICIHDLNHLDKFIRDYSRQKERSID